MSMGRVCKCRPKCWMVTKRYHNTSAFNGYHRTPSDYSTVRCTKCGAYWRTKADYVPLLPDAPDNWWNMTPGQLAAVLFPEPCASPAP